MIRRMVYNKMGQVLMREHMDDNERDQFEI